MNRVLVLAVALSGLGACSLDFDALERGRRDAGTDLDARVPAPDADVLPDAALDAPADSGSVECTGSGSCEDPACTGQPCDDGLACTMGDVCVGTICRGATQLCPSDGCSMSACEEPTGACVQIDSLPDGTACPGGRCCSGLCSSLGDNASCGGCGLACDEESCTTLVPRRCTCSTSGGCPGGQQCVSGNCVCSADGQCAAGQTCVVATGHCSY